MSGLTSWTAAKKMRIAGQPKMGDQGPRWVIKGPRWEFVQPASIGRCVDQGSLAILRLGAVDR